MSEQADELDPLTGLVRRYVATSQALLGRVEYQVSERRPRLSGITLSLAGVVTLITGATLFALISQDATPQQLFFSSIGEVFLFALVAISGFVDLFGRHDEIVRSLIHEELRSITHHMESLASVARLREKWQAEIVHGKQQSDLLQRDCESQRQQLARLKSEMDIQLAAHAEMQAQHQRDHQSLETAIKTSQSEFELRQSQQDDLQRNFASLQRDFGTLQRDFEDLQIQLQDLQSQRTEIQSTLDLHSERLNTLRGECEDAQMMQMELTSEASELQSQVQQLAVAKQVAEEELLTTKVECEQAQHELAELVSQRNTAKEQAQQIQQFEPELVKQQARVRKAQQACRLAESRLAIANAQRQTIEDSQRNYARLDRHPQHSQKRFPASLGAKRTDLEIEHSVLAETEFLAKQARTLLQMPKSHSILPAAELSAASHG